MSRAWCGSWSRDFRIRISDRLFAAQGGICGCCGKAMTKAHRDDESEAGWSLEHVWPRGRFDYRHRGNITLAHRGCNNLKDGRDPTEFEIQMLDLVNAHMGWRTARRGSVQYADPITAPTALAIALRQALR